VTRQSRSGGRALANPKRPPCFVSVPDLCARRSDRLLQGSRPSVILAASYRHAPLDVARPQPDVVLAEWPHAAAHSESRP
jgi:hypothetical protein